MQVFVVDVDGLPASVDDVLRSGGVAILPTDTIYGLSVRADLARAVRKIDRLKGRNRPSTLIPHDRAWLASLVEKRRRRQLRRLMTRYRGSTLLLRYQPDDPRALPKSLTTSGLLGVREPRHWITDFTRRLGFPLVTTSVNVSGEKPMTSLDDLDPRIAAGVDVVVYEGPHAGRPSDLIYLDGARARRVKRS